MILVGLPPELESVRNQILSAPIIPTYDIVSEQLLRLSISHTVATPSATAVDSSALVSHSSDRGSGRNEGRGKQNRHCNYCRYFGHIEVNCHKKAREQSSSANVAHVPNTTSSTDFCSLTDITISASD
uniref:Retrovirus-related Pol polyprotein from transposon TNT 1-94 n=1 Tax=Cajanus cajan TaxID=3821 RepID=A0A151RNS6_CAJCA|nr:hypothetical protein KK1_034334 [Cajanus cajan]KYP44190.1 hypothetical protein KK1_034354 [Cajanus cajan]